MDCDEPRRGSFNSAGLQLNYVDWGNRHSPPLLLIHGGEDHARSWDLVARELRSDFHVIAPDLRGHGDSDWSPDGDYAMGSFLGDLAEMVDQLGLAPVTIVGHSLGGNIAVRFSGVFPENVVRLVAIEGLRQSRQKDSVLIEEKLRQWIGKRRRLGTEARRRYPSIESATARMRQANSHLTEEQARHLSVHGLTQDEEGSYSWKFDRRIRAHSPVDLSDSELHSLWSRISCPVWLPYGARSWASSPAEDARIDHFQNARVSIFADAGHWVHHDALQLFLAELRAFLGSANDNAPESRSGSTSLR